MERICEGNTDLYTGKKMKTELILDVPYFALEKLLINELNSHTPPWVILQWWPGKYIHFNNFSGLELHYGQVIADWNHVNTSLTITGDTKHLEENMFYVHSKNWILGDRMQKVDSLPAELYYGRYQLPA